MRICMIGTGYVGLVAGTCFAESGNDVVCVDLDKAKIAQLQAGGVPIFEPGLEELIRRNLSAGRLSFSTQLDGAVEGAEIVFIAVGTPTGEDGSSDLRHVLKAARDVAERMTGPLLIVTKSTVPVGTSSQIKEAISSIAQHPFQIVSNPEFLKEGRAIEDFMMPDRVVIGAECPEAAETMQRLYAPFVRTRAPILVMDPRSAEMTKYAANAMLACRISFMNEIANLCEVLDADVDQVRTAIGSDRRIGRSFLFPGVGYGGSCFPKDIRALMEMGRRNDHPLELIEAIERVNQRQKRILLDKLDRFYASEGADVLAKIQSEQPTPMTETQCRLVVSSVQESPAVSEGRPDLNQRTFAVWGLSFKPRTDDMREAPSLTILRELIKRGATIRAFDPAAMDACRRLLGDQVKYCDSNYEALEGADALLLLTEWDLFRTPDFERMRNLLKQPVIFDGRNQYQPDEMERLGFVYFAIGRATR